ncbi:P-type DNA transfer ATPase VirB11 [Sphingomonas immobilis]|uniref:Type IV secretion system protein n=1 Tax=Sphingomonas immobilis TaxID=3063997 RepID=A0ABT9A0T1_9SPHN|nr:P-type DNA transfer ATPase VirB11 [Sphingomonas sp. CA1-15]MDO7843138.1 P-type DNA transfer ATPase VirB11 [Sphingomonas sp. CA1-15]
MNAEPVYLHRYLAPLADALARGDVTDLYINRPAELWIETLHGTIERHDVPALDEATLARLARQVAALSHQGISREHPLLSATLPDGARVQIVAPPATRGPLALAIRKHLSADIALDDYVSSGAFAETQAGDDAGPSDLDRLLRERLAARDFAGLLSAAVKGRKNILVSGGTSTGKTTFLNALIGEIPPEERLILIEDTPELRLRHPNAVGLLAARSTLGEAHVSASDLLGASLRMRPDRIIVGELRGDEAYTFLRAVNTGHPGSMTTIHADSPERAVEQLALLVLQTGTRLSREDVHHYVRSTIDVFVQVARTGGRRVIQEMRLARDDSSAL